MLLVKVLKVNILLVSKLLHCLDHGHQVTIVFVKGAKLIYCWLRSPSCCPCTVGQCRQVVIMSVSVYKSLSCCSMSPSGFAVGQCLKATILLVSKLRYCEALYFLSKLLHCWSRFLSHCLYTVVNDTNFLYYW